MNDPRMVPLIGIDIISILHPHYTQEAKIIISSDAFMTEITLFGSVSVQYQENVLMRRNCLPSISQNKEIINKFLRFTQLTLSYI